jgi:hypothetical protein
LSPYAVTAYGDNVYVVDDQAKVHVAVEAGTSFATFWAGDAGDVVTSANRIAASSAGVFWTLVGGIRYCPLDGGACGLLQRGGTPTLIAAGDSVVAWKEAGDAGIGRCDVPLSQCTTPTSIPTEPPTSIAVEPDGTIAFAASNRAAIGFVGAGPRTFVPAKGNPVQYVAADTASGALYWIGPYGVGAVPFDAGMVSETAKLSNGTPSQLFALDAVAYWSVPIPTETVINYCSFADGGCQASHPVGTVAANNRTDQGVAATSRDVFTILSGPSGNPQLYAWSVPR